MPRRKQPPRLYFREDEGTWIIRDGARSIRTGCGADDSGGAEKALATYLADRFVPVARERDPDKVTVAEALTAYGAARAEAVKAPATIGYAITALTRWWEARPISDVRGSTCAAYALARHCMVVRGKNVGDGTVRRELGVLQAAINHWHANHGPLVAVPTVTLPGVPPSRYRWLTRSEAALLLAGALGWYRERWSDIATRQESHRWRRDHTRINRHAARFIVIGLATGTRSGAILALRWLPSTAGGWVDFDRCVLHRRGDDEGETKKRRPPVRISARLIGHMKRWRRTDEAARTKEAPHVVIVNFRGHPVLKIRSAWESAIELAGLDSAVTPHTLRHTRATWLMQAGIDLWEAAGSLGMSPQVLQDTYGHHHPAFQKRAAEV